MIESSANEGIKIKTGVKIDGITENSPGYAVQLGSGNELLADLVINGAGRVADIDTLQLEKQRKGPKLADISTNRNETCCLQNSGG